MGRRAGFLISILVSFAVAASPAQAAFPGENGKIVFAGQPDGGGTDLFTINPDGTGQATLLANDAVDENPAWSPDGTKVAFSRMFCDEFCSRRDIYVVNVDGTGELQLTGAAGDDTQPAWAPDSRRIVFSSTRESDFSHDLWVVNADGTGLTQLTNDARREAGPKWSPSGSSIAFGSSDGTETGIYVMSAHGGAPTRITGPAGGGFDWSPDGSKFVFSRSESNIFFDYAIYTVNSDGTGETKIYDDNRVNQNPVWSPLGDKIAFDGKECAAGSPGCLPADVFTINPDGSGLTSLTESNTTWDTGPDWQPLPVRPRREDFKNGPAFCRAEREFLGEDGFAAQYRNFGKCVSGKS